MIATQSHKYNKKVTVEMTAMGNVLKIKGHFILVWQHLLAFLSFTHRFINVLNNLQGKTPLTLNFHK